MIVCDILIGNTDEMTKDWVEQCWSVPLRPVISAAYHLNQINVGYNRFAYTINIKMDLLYYQICSKY